MEYAAALLLIFAALLFFYAALLVKTKNPKYLPRSYAAKVDDESDYTERVGKALALTALAPVCAAIVARLTDSALLTMLTLIGGFILLMWLSIRRMKG